MTDGAREPHTHDWSLWVTFHHAPCGPPPEHTAFLVVTCPCGACDVFPRVNFELTTAAFQAEFIDAARRAGWELTPGDDGGGPD